MWTFGGRVWVAMRKGESNLAPWNTRRSALEREYERQQVREALARIDAEEKERAPSVRIGSGRERFLTPISAKREDELLYGRSAKG